MLAEAYAANGEPKLPLKASQAFRLLYQNVMHHVGTWASQQQKLTEAMLTIVRAVASTNSSILATHWAIRIRSKIDGLKCHGAKVTGEQTVEKGLAKAANYFDNLHCTKAADHT